MDLEKQQQGVVCGELLEKRSAVLIVASSYAVKGSSSSTTVCVKNVGPHIFHQVLKQLKRFGTVKMDTLKWMTNVPHFFIDFENAQCAKNAINASPLLVDKHRIYVEKRL